MAAREDSERIVITGIGVVSSIGIGREAFWKGLAEGRSGIKPVTLFDVSSVRSKLAGEISDFKPEEILGPKGLRNLDRTTKLALCAAKLALDDSGFEITEENTHQVGVVLGSTMGSVWSISEFDKEGIRNGPRAVNPALFPNTVMNSPASQISIRFGIKGFNTTISTGFTSSLEALAYAETFISLKRANAVLVGGVEELCEQTYKGCYKTGFLSASRNEGDELCAPFDSRRNGIILGEGSAIFLIESREHAVKRNAHIYGELAGRGSAYDRLSFNQYNPKATGAKIAIGRAIKASGISPDKIDCVAAGANSTLSGDVAEARALLSLVGAKIQIIASASKSMTGETFSAGGAFQIASALMTLQEGIVPPTINFQKQDRRCFNIDCVPNQARQTKIKNILVSNLSPMGQNSSMILST